MELDLDALMASWGASSEMEEISTQPAVYEDLAIIVDEAAPAAQVTGLIRQTGGKLLVEPATPVTQLVNTAGTGDLLSVCLMLLHSRKEIPIPEKLRLANRIVSEYIEGRRDVSPTQTRIAQPPDISRRQLESIRALGHS